MLIRRARADESAALLREQMRRGACARRGGFVRGGGRGGMFGPRGGGGASDPRLLLYSDGTIVRSTEASMPLLYQPGDVVTWVPPNTLRQSSILTPDGLPYFAFEGSRTNAVAFSEVLAQLNAATENTNVGGEPDGGSDADELTITGAGGYARWVGGLVQNIRYVGSWFGQHVSGDADWLCRLTLAGAGNLDTAAALTSQWQRLVTPGGIHTVTGNGVLYALENGAGNNNVANLWGWQVEHDGGTGARFPSSYIRTSAAQLTRPEDRLTIPQASVPAEFGTGKWHIYFRALWAHAEAASNARIFQIGSTNQFSLWWDAGASAWRLYKNATLLASRGGTWSRGQEILFTVDSTGAGALTIAGMTTGNGTSAFASNPAYTAGDLIIGGYTSTGFSAFGLISEPVLEAA